MEWQTIPAGRAQRIKASEFRELLKLLDRPDILSFAGGIPDPRLLREASAAALAAGSAAVALQYSVSEGCRPLRTWIAGQMPPQMDGATLLARSIETGKVAFAPGRAFFADGSNGNTLRLSFSCADEATITEGIARLGRLIAREAGSVPACARAHRAPCRAGRRRLYSSGPGSPGLWT